MEILGIGPLEILFILLIAFVVLGPGDMAKTGRQIGRFLRNLVTSPWWTGFRNASREISQLPYTLMREASIEEAAKELDELNTIGNDLTAISPPNKQPDFSSWINPERSIGDSHSYSDSDNTKL
jgi:Sec-independent protein translocase protein TatA